MSDTQKKLGKVRPSRVHITYDVEAGDNTTQKELPLVIGVIGEFSESEIPFKNRTFVKIDKDNFNDVMKGMKPAVSFSVPCTLPGHEGALSVDLVFNSVEDFSPDNIANQVPSLKKLLEMRQQLIDLRNRTASNERLKDELTAILRSRDNRVAGNSEGNHS